MKLTGDQLLPCSPQQAWDLLMSPDVLQSCIPGCESLTQNTPETFTAIVTMKVGPVKARFSGEVHLMELDAPNSCKLKGKGNGGIAGFAEGGAAINLIPEGDGVRLQYDSEAQVGGKLAQLGSRLIDSTAKKLALAFFENLQAEITKRTA